MSRLRANAGFTLIELMLAMTLMLIIMSAALFTFERFAAGNESNQKLAADADSARNGLDLIARDARNATAYQTTANATAAAVLRADPQDFVFKTVDSTAAAAATNDYRVRTVRYCYASTDKQLVRQTKADAVAPGPACPDPTWRSTTAVPYVVNGGRTMFTYDSATLASVTWARVDLYVDSTPNKKPVETPLHSGIFLRNANRPPVADFTATATPKGHVRLNGSASSDPDGALLTYTWQDGSTTLTEKGPVVDYVTTVAGTHTFQLTITDPGGLTATSTKTVTVTL